MAAFQILAMRFAARVWIPGTAWVALLLFMDLVGLIMFQLGKRLVLCVTMLLSHHVLEADLCNSSGDRLPDL